eukprot:scaffold632532_cov37-Prasinocladus_malaysianus.AAC.1
MPSCCDSKIAGRERGQVVTGTSCHHPALPAITRKNWLLIVSAWVTAVRQGVEVHGRDLLHGRGAGRSDDSEEAEAGRRPIRRPEASVCRIIPTESCCPGR